jgi:hypothetical protein
MPSLPSCYAGEEVYLFSGGQIIQKEPSFFSHSQTIYFAISSAKVFLTTQLDVVSIIS